MGQRFANYGELALYFSGAVEKSRVVGDLDYLVAGSRDGTKATEHPQAPTKT